MYMSEEEISKEKEEAHREIVEVLDKLGRQYPEITEGLAAILGSGAGVAGGIAAIAKISVRGLSGPGIVNALAKVGRLVGGGMVRGMGVFGLFVALVGIVVYHVAKSRRDAKLSVALGTAIERLYDVQIRLMDNAESFKEEIAEIKVAIDLLNRSKLN